MIYLIYVLKSKYIILHITFISSILFQTLEEILSIILHFTLQIYLLKNYSRIIILYNNFIFNIYFNWNITKWNYTSFNFKLFKFTIYY